MFALRLAVLKHIVSWDLESDTYECTLYSTHHIQISLLYNTVNIVVVVMGSGFLYNCPSISHSKICFN